MGDRTPPIIHQKLRSPERLTLQVSAKNSGVRMVVLRSQGEAKWVDLGDAAAIDSSVANLRIALKQPKFPKLKQVQGLARKLDEQIMAPIRPLLGNVPHVLLSPDGQLTLIPFEALVDEQGKYLIQRYAFSYLTSGRDLLRFESPTNSRSSGLHSSSQVIGGQ